MDQVEATTWIAVCAHHLQKHFRTVDPDQLEEVARELLANDHLEPMGPAEAAAVWLRPVVVSGLLKVGEETATPRVVSEMPHRYLRGSD